jgi:5,10-methylenetetrahydrofolate reductase
MMNLNNAIFALYPNIVLMRGDTAYDADGNEVAYDKDAVQAYVDANAYKDLRAAAYPSFADQFDTIFHEGIDAWKAQIQAVKDRYPKS